MDEKKRQKELLRTEIQERLLKKQEKANESLDKIYQTILDTRKMVEEVKKQLPVEKNQTHLRLVPPIESKSTNNIKK